VQALHVDREIYSVDLAATSTSLGWWPGVDGDVLQLECAANACLRRAPIAPRRLELRLFAVITLAKLTVGFSKVPPVQLPERKDPSVEPSLASVVGIDINVGRQRLPEVSTQSLGWLR